jgi:HlyD family secretion protein
LVGLLATGGVYWWKYARTGSPGEDAYTLAPIEYGPMVESVSATGLLQPREIVAVGSPLSGMVVQIYPGAEVNKTVHEGDPLLKLDDRKALLDLDQAKTAVRLAEADVKRAESLESSGQQRVNRLRQLLNEAKLGSEAELDEAEGQLKAAIATVQAAKVKVDQARDAVNLAQYGLDLTVVRAGGEGAANKSPSEKRSYVIIDRKVVLGQLIGPPASAQLFTLASDLNRMQVHAQVSENDIGKIKADLPATFTVYTYSEEDTHFSGKVLEVRPMPTNLHGAVFYDTIIDVDPKTSAGKLRPGMTASVDLILRTHPKVWKMPTAALSLQLDEHYQSDAAKAKIAHWQSRKDHDDWKSVWILDANHHPWPIFVRIGGKIGGGAPGHEEMGIKDSQYNEVLDWDPELSPQPDPKVPSSYLQVITGAPAAPKRGLFNQPNVKLF